MESVSPALRRRRTQTLLLLMFGYAGYYLCRADLSVCMPYISEELGKHGLSAADAKVRLGAVVSWGTMAYALGKFASGGFADLQGGRRSFLTGMVGVILFTLLFAVGGPPLFTLAWIGNRAFQSLGWPAMVKLSSRWFPAAAYGGAMAVVSLSYLFGDAAARAFLGELLGRGVSWRGVFCASAGGLFLLLGLSALMLRESPTRIGEPEPAADPRNLYGSAGDTGLDEAGEPRLRHGRDVSLDAAGETGLDEAGEGGAGTPLPVGSKLMALLKPLLASPAFLLVCLISFGFTLIRETFNTWTPTYYTEAVRMSKSEAARMSALFPLYGGISVLLAGFGSDRLGPGGRARIMVGGMIAATLSLLALSRLPPDPGRFLPVTLVSVTAMALLGPYSYLAGAMSLEFGGKRGSAVACGIIDGIGYFGGIFAGDAVARLSNAYGWSGAFLALAGIAALSGVASGVLRRVQTRATPAVA